MFQTGTANTVSNRRACKAGKVLVPAPTKPSQSLYGNICFDASAKLTRSRLAVPRNVIMQ